MRLIFFYYVKIYWIFLSNGVFVQPCLFIYDTSDRIGSMGQRLR